MSALDNLLSETGLWYLLH